jgi:RND family efflux transporter MFP subunit
MNRLGILSLACMIVPSQIWAQEAVLRPVVSEIVAADAGQSRSFPGLIVAKVEASLGFQTAGRVAERPVSIGDRVTKGDTLARLDQVTLEQDVTAARAALSAAQASADLGEQSLERAQELAKRGVAATAQLETAQANRDASAAQVLAAEADLARAQDAARFATLRAPMDGVVLSTSAEPGAVVSAGSTVLTLASEAGREAVIDVPSDMVALLPPAAQFRIVRQKHTQALPSTTAGAAQDGVISGVVRLIEPVADSSTRARRLRVTLDETGADLRLGTLVTAELDLAATPVLTVPVGAIIEGVGPHGHVWRVAQGRVAERVSVELGTQMSGRVVVTSGLDAGDEILTRGVHSVTEGMALGPRIGGGQLDTPINTSAQEGNE